MNMMIKELRRSLGLTQSEAAAITHIPLRTYKNYENDLSKRGSVKYQYIVKLLEEYGRVDEEHGVLTIEEIIKSLKPIFDEHHVEYCFLFGSYAKNTAKETSDADLLISTTLTGLKFYGFVDKLRTALHKKVDVLTLAKLENNPLLLNEILKDGIKIYR